MDPSTPFSETLQLSIGHLFIKVVRETCPIAAEILFKKMTLHSSHNCDLLPLLSEIENYPISIILQIAEFDAKLIDVQWSSRKMAGINILNAVAETERVQTGDTFDEVIRRFCKANLSISSVQELIEYAMVWCSLTTHPTNPTSFAYTSVSHSLDVLLSNPKTTRSQLLSKLREIRDTSMMVEKDGKSLKKTPQLEGEELMLIISTLYESVLEPQHRLRAALERYGYRDVDDSEHRILDLNVWGVGDGDGNPNVTAPLMEWYVKRLREELVAKYVADLTTIVSNVDEEFNARKETIVVKLLKGEYKTGEELVNDIRNWVRSHSIESSPPIGAYDMIIKAKNFGLHFSRIDVRHNSVDIMETLEAILEVIKLPSAEAKLSQMAPNEQRSLIQKLLLDDDFELKVRTCISEDCKELGELGRVFGRCRVMAKYPDMFQKLIIAETRSTANILAGLLLLKLAGCKVGVPGATISVVPLFESRQDLTDAPSAINAIATDPIFSRHLNYVGYLLVMIAKSDTTRLSGPGVQGCQELTIGQVLAMQTQSYSGFKVHVFVGGGDDQMRGGGRIVELPHTVMLAANRMGSHRPNKVALTIQGRQMQIVFGSNLQASHFLEAFSAQQMLAASRITGHIPFRSLPPNVNRSAALHHAANFFTIAMDSYEKGIGSEKPEDPTRDLIVRYYSSYPADIVASANKSSRPMSRKKTNDPLRGRAIGLDQLSKHDGAYLTATLGVRDALKALYNSLRYGSPSTPNGPPLSPLRHMYLANKSFRDFVRMQAVVLCQKEFAVSWAIRGGVPSEDERGKLVEEFQKWEKAGRPGGASVPSVRSLLAYLEDADGEEAAYLIDALTGILPETKNAKLYEPIKVGWPNLYKSLEVRKHQSALSQAMQIRNMQRINKGEQEPALKTLAYYGYVGTNPKFSSPNFSLTMTDPQKEGGKMLSENETSVHSRLRLPKWTVEMNLQRPKL